MEYMFIELYILLAMLFVALVGFGIDAVIHGY